MPSPKSLRSAPSRTFENYILTLSVDHGLGLLKVPQEKFSQVPGPPGNSGNDDNTSNPLDIGFPFEFDGITYYQYMVSTNGWVILVDPTTPAGTPNGTIVTDVMVNTYSNARINSLFARNHALFAVWYDDLLNMYSSPNAIDLSLSQQQISFYEKGINQPDKRVNPRKYGVQYYNENNSNEGRRLILRWNCISDYLSPNSILNFEFVLYENGKIEYRYAQRDQIGDTTAREDATIGVFMPGSTWRFRDFSYELGYGSSTRPRYFLGGAVSGSYTDTADSYTVPYGVGLKPETYWPGQKNSGAVFTFQPPLNRRKVLPRLALKEKDSKITLPTVARTGDSSRSGTSNSMFDDRRSIVYKTRNDINYPSMLPRFYASTSLIESQNQDLFFNDFVTVGSITKQAVEQFLEDNSKNYISPFTENKLFENDPGSDSDSFFTIGSSVQDVGEGFNQSLKSKTQIKLSYRVDHKTTMFGASSSIYYYNSKTGRWQYPTSSFKFGFDIADHYEDTNNGRMTEVDRGFNAFGFNISSGSASNRAANFPNTATDPSFNRYLTRQSEIELMAEKYGKTIQINQEYNAVDDETITIPINQPFLLEKAVIEIPIEAGPGWFYDRTQCILPNDGTNLPAYVKSQDGAVFDIGGPGITFALYNQLPLGREKYRRDLILSGTVTHDLDNTAKIAYFQMLYGSGYYGGGSTSYADIYQCTPRGFLAYGTPSGIVKGNNNLFTGSAKFKCIAAISNGILIRDSAFIDQDPSLYSSNRVSAVTEMFKSPTLKLNKKGDIQDFYSITSPPSNEGDGCKETLFLNVNNFSRSAIGFEPSGRSILGKEYVTSQAKDKKDPDMYDNPFYLYKDSIVQLSHGTTGPVSEGAPEDVDTIIQDFSLNYPVMIMTHVIQKQSVRPSPYLLFPNDKLILSISKSRPFFLSTEAISPYTMNQIEHDIKLTTGSIHITLYGSLISNGKEFHDTLNQPLSSDAIHEVVIGETKT
jgi:hypothetical protein